MSDVLNQPVFLYFTTVFIWGSTWLALKFQIGVVAPEWSVAYRFALAAALLLAYCVWRQHPLRFSARQHLWLLALGSFLFSLNYVLFYIAAGDMTSGLLAVVFSSIAIMNVFNGRLFLKRPIRVRVLLGAVVGLLGIVLVFWPEFAHTEDDQALWLGVGLSILATFSASLGNIVSARNQAEKMPVVSTNAVSMAYGAGVMVLFAAFSGNAPTFDAQPLYIGALIYLALFGSVLAFGSYLTLIGLIGADKAGYASVLFPIVALLLSTWFEGYEWTSLALLGVALVLLGNVIISGVRWPIAQRNR